MQKRITSGRAINRTQRQPQQDPRIFRCDGKRCQEVGTLVVTTSEIFEGTTMNLCSRRNERRGSRFRTRKAEPLVSRIEQLPHYGGTDKPYRC